MKHYPIIIPFTILILYLLIIINGEVVSSSSYQNLKRKTQKKQIKKQEECKAWLVQSIPTDMSHLSLVPGVLSTADVFRWLAGNSSQSLDVMAQYWQLVAHPQDPHSGNYGYSEADMQNFGAKEGLGVYKALEDASDRKVNIRLLQHSGVYPDYTEEPSTIASGRPNVKNVTLLLGQWWGSGIVHAKVWISDNRDVYIGSANNDWKSLTQVKEVGVYLVDCPTIAEKVEVYYNNLWKLAALNVSAYTKTVWDQQWQITRKVPCWSHFVHHEERCRQKNLVLESILGGGMDLITQKLYKLLGLEKYVCEQSETISLLSLTRIDEKFASLNFDTKHWRYTLFFPCLKEKRSPLPHYLEVPHVEGYPQLSDPYMFELPIQTPGVTSSTVKLHLNYLSFAPPELLFGKYQADEQAWVDTIKSIGFGSTVRISTMDWLGQSQFTTPSIYWSSLSSAISEVIFSKRAKVKILVAHWAHFLNGTDQYLKSLLYSNTLCASSKYNNCSGQIDIKYYVVPGFNLTGPAISNGTKTGNIYPGYTRVNHGKYAVSDERAHIGTSNLIWDYFYTTAGVSFGTYNPAIVSQLQQIFEADWNSPYTIPVEPLKEARSYSS